MDKGVGTGDASGSKTRLPHSHKQEVDDVLAACRITDLSMFDDAALLSHKPENAAVTGNWKRQKQIVPWSLWRQHRPRDTLILSLITITNTT